MTTPLTPSLAGSAVNPAGGKVGVATSNDFVLLMWSFRSRYYSEVFEKTGGGDALPVYANRGDLQGRVSLSGVAVAGEAIGIANLIDATKNPLIGVQIILDGTRKQVITIFAEDIQSEWHRKRGFMPVTLTGYLHNTTPGNIETTVA